MGEYTAEPWKFEIEEFNDYTPNTFNDTSNNEYNKLNTLTQVTLCHSEQHEEGNRYTAFSIRDMALYVNM